MTVSDPKTGQELTCDPVLPGRFAGELARFRLRVCDLNGHAEAPYRALRRAFRTVFSGDARIRPHGALRRWRRSIIVRNGDGWNPGSGPCASRKTRLRGRIHFDIVASFQRTDGAPPPRAGQLRSNDHR